MVAFIEGFHCSVYSCDDLLVIQCAKTYERGGGGGGGGVRAEIVWAVVCHSFSFKAVVSMYLISCHLVFVTFLGRAPTLWSWW